VSSARIGASGFSAQYGYFEARMLAPAGTGSWPAFWMLDTEAARDPSQGQGEVDAVELYGHNPIGACHTIHNWGPGDDHDADGRCLDDHELGDWALMWHTYGVQIRPDGADMFIDGVPVASLDGLERHDLPYFFMVNMALGGGWPVDLGPTGGELELYVDWVRVYT
jgi:beta-glucanase (GH16 family)